MNIAIVHTDFRIYWPARLHALHALLVSKGHTLTVIEITGQGSDYAFHKEKAHDESYWRVLFPNDTPETLAPSIIRRALFKTLDGIMPDVVVAGAIAFPSGAISTSWAKQKKKRIIIFDDSKKEDVERNGLVNYIKRCIYKNVDSVIYPAEEWLDTASFWEFRKEQVFCGLDVVDNDFWANNFNVKKPFYGAIVIVARLLSCKNVAAFINAYCSIKDTVTPMLHIIGDGPEKVSLQKLVKDNNADDKIKFHPFMTQEELRDVYHSAGAFVLCSWYETWGLVLNEAAACGCVLLASKKCGATKTLVKNNVNGFVFDPYSVENIASAIRSYLLTSDEERKKMGMSSQKIVSEWGLEKFADTCLKASEYVMSRDIRKPSFIESVILRFWNGRYHTI